MVKKRVPLEFKSVTTKINLLSHTHRRKSAKSIIDFVLIASNINPAQREALKKAKELLNDK